MNPSASIMQKIKKSVIPELINLPPPPERPPDGIPGGADISIDSLFAPGILRARREWFM